MRNLEMVLIDGPLQGVNVKLPRLLADRANWAETIEVRNVEYRLAWLAGKPPVLLCGCEGLFHVYSLASKARDRGYVGCMDAVEKNFGAFKKQVAKKKLKIRRKKDEQPPVHFE